MKKIYFLLHTVLFFCVATQAQTIAVKEVEPNNTFGTATSIASNPAKIYGNVFPNADVDWYSFTASAGDKVYSAVITSFSSNASSDAQLRLYASDGTTLIEFDDDDGQLGTLSSTIAGATIPSNGTYYLEVRHFSATNQLRNYDLYLKVQTGAPTPEVESNDTPGSANVMPGSGWVSGARDPAAGSEQDWFSVTLAAGESVFISLDLDPERDNVQYNGRLGFALFGDADNQILVVDDASTGTVANPLSEAFFFTAKNAGTYYVFADASSAAVGGPTATYTISYSKFAANSGYVSYASTNVPQVIGPGTGSVSSTLTIADSKLIKDLSVRITLDHTLMGDIDATLTSPNGNTIALFTDIGAAAAGGQAQMDLFLNDNNAIPPTFTVLRPVGIQPELGSKLDQFKGMNTAGVWTLTLYDDGANANGGNLTGWSIDVLEEVPPNVTGANVIANEDFEASDGGFTHSASAGLDEWERGTPSFAPITTANSGTNCWKTDLDNTYDASSIQTLSSASYAIPAGASAKWLSWAMKYQMENRTFDSIRVYVEEVGNPANSKTLFEWLGATQTSTIGNPSFTLQMSAGWGTHWADITSFSGLNVQFKVMVGSDNTVQFAGAAIDDFKIYDLCTPSSITLGASPSVCGGTTSVGLPYTATTGTPDQYSIDYDAAAEAQGFVDVVNAALPTSPITLTVPAGAAVSTIYNGSITVRLAAGGCVSPAVAFTVSITTPCPPTNDDCANAIPIVCGGSASGSTQFATIDGPGTDCGGGSVAPDVWYTIVGTGGNITASVCGAASYDTQIDVYTGVCGALVNIGGCSDDFCGLQSEMTWASVFGTTYFIRMHGFGGATGTYTLTMTCSGPTILTTGTLLPFVSCASSPSAEQSFTVSGSALIANLVVTAPAGFEVSTTSGSGFASSVSLTPSSGVVPVTTIFVRLSAAASGTPAGNITCTSTGATTQNVAASGTVNPIPDAVATPSSQTVCSGTPITTIVLSGSVGGTVYNWTRDNTVAVTGIAPGGSGDISGTLTNTTNAPVTVTFTITPTASGCPGTAITATVLVNPTPNAVATPASQTLCSANPITTIVLSGAVSGTVFNWTRDNTVAVTGIAAGGAGDISGTLTNTTAAPVTVTFTITPTANGCPGTPILATVTVAPTPTVNAVANQIVCNGAPTAAVTFSGPVAGTIFNWVNNTPSIGLAASGTGDIASFIATNTGTTAVTGTITVTPNVNTTTCTGTSTTFTQSTALAIPTGPAVVSSTLIVSGAPTYLYDLDVITNLTHTFAADLDITITSPSGTVVTLTTDNGAGNDNVFNGTVWNDKANPLGQVPYTTNNGIATDNAYVNLTAASALAPEEPLGAFIGEDPNGTWTITISDDLAGDGGSLDSWSLVVTGLSAAPTLTSSSFTQSTALAIPTGPAVVSSTLVVSGAGTQLHDVNLTTFLTHTFAADLDITIQSPLGTVVTLTTDNGAGNDNVFNGTIWDDDANPLGQVPYTTNNGMVTDNAYVNLTLASPLTPEEALAAFIGEDPNGTWTITISDDLAGDGGSLASWTLNLQTAVCPGVNCTGTPITYTYTVNPTPTAIATPSSQTICSATPITTIALTGAVAGTTYDWTRDNTVAVTGIAAGGTGNINGTLTNTTIDPVTVTFTITPTANGCPGLPIIATVLVNPTPVVTIAPAAPVICNGAIQQLTASVAPPQLATFSQPATTLIQDAILPATIGLANPYPSVNTVSGLPTTGVTVKSVKLGNFNHTFPDDVDIVLVSPTGQSVILMSDAGGNGDVVGLDYTFDDAAAGTMPTNGPIPQGTYRPSNYGSGDDWPAPGPGTAPSSTTLSTFTGDPNGAWRLYVVDAFGGDVGFIGNWNITFNVAQAVVFSPTTNLFTNALATIPYTGTPINIVYAKPTVTTIYTATTSVYGCAGSGTVTVTVNQLPAITVQPTPATQTICPGFNVSYSVTATGAGLTYQWKQGVTNLVDNAQISGATTSTLTITGVNVSNSGTYTCVVSGTCPPPATSSPVVLNVATAPVISTPPANRTVCVGQTANFTVATVGSVPPATMYQWQISTDNGANWTNLTTGGANSASFTTAATTAAMNNNRFRVHVTNDCGQTATSASATLTVNAVPVVTATALTSRICLSDTLIALSGSPVGGSWSGIGVSGFNFVPSATAVGTYNLTYTYTNSLGCTASATIVAKVEDCQERLRLLRDDAVILYPNPNNGRFNIKINSTLYSYLGMKVYDQKGQLVNGKVINDEITSPVFNGLVYGRVIPVDLSYLPAGVYLVKLYYDDGVRTSEKGFQVVIAGH